MRMFVRTKIRANQCSGCGGAVDPTEILDLVAKGKSVREHVEQLKSLFLCPEIFSP